uniref:ABC transporter D family member 1-like n=1 Tax=Rhizophora mucronata TaxID=61149 RepID=A0A2P2MUD4_RHIMU
MPAPFPIQGQNHIMESNQSWTMRYCYTGCSHGSNFSTKTFFHVCRYSTSALIKNCKLRLMVKQSGHPQPLLLPQGKFLTPINLFLRWITI